MAVTIKASAQAWASDGSSRAWTARVLWDTGSALYAILQDSGASPKVRVLKADSRTAPTSFTEVDSANNKSGVQNLSYDSYWDGALFQILIHTATNTVTHYTFDPSTDMWGAGNGNASTAIVGYRSIRICKVPGNSEIVGFGADSTDNSDLRYVRYASGAWTTALVLSVTSTPSSRPIDIQASGNFAHMFYYDMANTDFSDRSLSGATLGTETDMDTSAASSSESVGACGGRFNPWTSGGNPVASTVFGNISSSLMGTRDVRLDLTSATQTAFSGPAYSSSAYGGASSWWDSATSTLWVVRGNSSTATTGNVLASSRVAGTWDGAVTTLVSSAMPIELAPIGIGCAYVYQDGSNNVIMEQLVAYVAPPIVISVPVITGSGDMVDPTLKYVVPVPVATGSGDLVDPAPVIRINSPVITGTGDMVDPQHLIGPISISIPVMTAIGALVAPSVSIRPQPPVATGTGDMVDPSPDIVAMPPAMAGTGAILPPSLSNKFSVPVMTGTGDLVDPAPMIIPAVPVMTGSGDVVDPTLSVYVQTPLMTGTGDMVDPAFLIGPNTFLVPTMTAAGDLVDPSLRFTVLPPVALGSGDMVDPVAKMTVMPPVMSATGVLIGPAVLIGPNLFVIPAMTGTGDLVDPTVGLSIPVPVITASGDMVDPGASMVVLPPTMTGTGAMPTPSLQQGAVVIDIPLMTGSGDLIDPSLSYTVIVPLATGSGDLVDPVIATKPQPPAMTGTGDLVDPAPSIRAQIPLITGSGDMIDPSLSVVIPNVPMTGSGDMIDPFVDVEGPALVIDVELMTGLAQMIAPTVLSLVSTPAMTATGLALAPVIRLSVFPGPMVGSGDMNDPLIFIEGEPIVIDVPVMVGNGGLFAPSIRVTVPVSLMTGSGSLLTPSFRADILVPSMVAVGDVSDPTIRSLVLPPPMAGVGDLEMPLVFSSSPIVIDVPTMMALGSMLPPTLLEELVFKVQNLYRNISFQLVPSATEFTVPVPSPPSETDDEIEGMVVQYRSEEFAVKDQ